MYLLTKCCVAVAFITERRTILVLSANFMGNPLISIAQQTYKNINIHRAAEPVHFSVNLFANYDLAACVIKTNEQDVHYISYCVASFEFLVLSHSCESYKWTRGVR